MEKLTKTLYLFQSQDTFAKNRWCLAPLDSKKSYNPVNMSIDKKSHISKPQLTLPHPKMLPNSGWHGGPGTGLPLGWPEELGRLFPFLPASSAHLRSQTQTIGRHCCVWGGPGEKEQEEDCHSHFLSRSFRKLRTHHQKKKKENYGNLPTCGIINGTTTWRNDKFNEPA